MNITKTYLQQQERLVRCPVFIWPGCKKKHAELQIKFFLFFIIFLSFTTTTSTTITFAIIKRQFFGNGT